VTTRRTSRPASRPGDRLEGGAAGRDHVLEDDDAAAFRDVVLDDASGAVVLRRLADEEAGRGRGARSRGAFVRGRAARPARAAKSPARARSQERPATWPDDRVGADGRAADGVDGAAVAPDQVVDEVEDHPGDEVQPLRVEGRALAVEEHVGALAGGQAKSPRSTHFSAIRAFSLFRASTGPPRKRLL